MAQVVREIMSDGPAMLTSDQPVAEAARIMRDLHIGDVLVSDNDELCGIVTDRDLALRVLAAGMDPRSTKLGDICSRDLVTVTPDEPLDEVVRAVRGKAIRRLPVVDDGSVVGVVSIGDLAVAMDRESALADLSAAPPNN